MNSNSEAFNNVDLYLMVVELVVNIDASTDLIICILYIDVFLNWLNLDLYIMFLISKHRTLYLLPAFSEF